MAPTTYTVDRLIGFAAAILQAEGVADRDARTTASRLVEGDARGQRAHGLARLPAYAQRIEEGGLNPTAVPRVAQESPVSALIDGDNGLGPVIMSFGVEVAAQKVRTAGLAWIGIRRSNHAGAGGVYAQMLVDQGLVTVIGAVANINQMAPWGGTERLLGPNPLAIGIPTGEEPPLILDMATSTVAFGTVRQAIAAGRELPVGWLIDDHGQPVTDPTRADEGTLAPIGGYKGYGLSLVIAALAGTLNGAAAGSDVVDHYADLTTPTNTGHLIIALDPQLFRPLVEFRHDMDVRLREIRNSMRQEGVDAIQIPGERSHARRERAAAEGIELSDALLADLRGLAERLGIADRLEA
jgi:L-2-hydroxycarboxylate dehydrogenase (NAD+)